MDLSLFLKSFSYFDLRVGSDYFPSLIFGLVFNFCVMFRDFC